MAQHAEGVALITVIAQKVAVHVNFIAPEGRNVFHSHTDVIMTMTVVIAKMKKDAQKVASPNILGGINNGMDR